MTVSRQIAVVTGTRADYGLLRPVMRAIHDHPKLHLQVYVTGTHLLSPALTIGEVEADFDVQATIPMQIAGAIGRMADAASLGRGIGGFADAFAEQHPDVVMVLGDRIEAFAAAAAAAVAGIRVAHLHGGDRAEGIADESLRHAISKLSHIHFPATVTSAQRLVAMGEDPVRIHTVGSPAIDGLAAIEPMRDSDYASLGKPQIIFLLHPSGADAKTEQDRAGRLIDLAQRCGSVLALHPNHDAGREGILSAIEASSVNARAHLDRSSFIGLLRRAKVLVGNSSAGLIEASAIPIRAVNIGSRQAGRETPDNVATIANWDYQTTERAIRDALAAAPFDGSASPHPYGDGSAGVQVAAILADLDPMAHALAKRNSY